MKLNKIISKALLAFAAIAGFASCSSDDYEMTSVPSNSQVYFSNEASTEYLLEQDQNTVEVEVNRVKTDGALTVNVQATDESGLFTAASSVTFADGEATAKLPINFDFSKLESDTDYPVTLKLLSDTCAYGDNTVTVNIKYAPWSEWTLLGNGETTFTYNVFVSGLYAQQAYYRESMLDNTKAQVMMTDWLYGVDLVFDWNKTTNELSVASQYTGYNHSSYGLVYVVDAYTYYTKIRGKEVSYEDYKSYYDPETGQFRLNLSYYVSAGSFGNGYEILQLPGYEQSDYSISIEDGGSYQSGKKLGQVFNMTMGSDLTSMKYAIFSGSLTADEVTEKANSIFSGDIESTSTSENGYKLTMVDAEGDYTLVVLGYDADSKWQATQFLQFTVKAPTAGKTWTDKYVGNYTYKVFFGSSTEPQVDEGLTMSACNEDNTLFKISHWGYDSDFLFTFAEDGSVVVMDGETGYTDSSYGTVMVGEAANVSSKYSDYSSTYDSSTGTFNFCVAYYCEAGIFGVGYETFQLTGNAAKAMSKAKAKAMNKTKKVTNTTKLSKFSKHDMSKFEPNSRTQHILNNKVAK